MNPASIIEFLVVGRTPLGGALRAGLIGVVATVVGTWFFVGSFGPLVVGSIVVVLILPVAYAISRRDDPHVPPEVEAAPPASRGEGDRSVPSFPERDPDGS